MTAISSLPETRQEFLCRFSETLKFVGFEETTCLESFKLKQRLGSRVSVKNPGQILVSISDTSPGPTTNCVPCESYS